MSAPTLGAPRPHLDPAAPLDRAAVWWVTLGALLYATGPTMVRASSVSGPVFSFWRLWFGATLFGVAALVRGVVTGRRPIPAGLVVTVQAGLAFGLHQLCFMSALKATSVTDVLLVQTLTPIAVGALAVPMFGERPGRRFRVWSGIAMAGAATVALGASVGPRGHPVGVLLAFLNVALFALFFVLSKRSRGMVDLATFLGGVLFVAALTVTAYVVTLDGTVSATQPRDLVLAASLALVPGGLGHLAMTGALHRVPANLPPVIKLPTPFVAGAITWLTLGEPMTVVHALGGAITLGGAFGAVRSLAGDRSSPGPRSGPQRSSGSRASTFTNRETAR